MKHVSGAKPISVQTLAQQFFDKTKSGDLAEASRKLAEYVDGIPSLRMELLMLAARSIMNGIVVTDRRLIERDMSYRSKADRSNSAPFRLNAAARATQQRRMNPTAVRAALMNLPYVIDGVCRPLREWTGTDMLHYGEIELVKGRTAMRNARFAIAVGNAAGDKKIGEALTEEALAKIKESSADE